MLATVTVNVPLFGGRIEETVAEQVRTLLAAETAFTQEWLRLQGGSERPAAGSHPVAPGPAAVVSITHSSNPADGKAAPAAHTPGQP